MSVRPRECSNTLWSATATTIAGPISFVGIIGIGSAAVGTIQVSDGTRAVFSLGLNITGQNRYTPAYPIAFSSNLITTVISTGAYSICFMPRP